jgi:hypothetical protein
MPCVQPNPPIPTCLPGNVLVASMLHLLHLHSCIHAHGCQERGAWCSCCQLPAEALCEGADRPAVLLWLC